MVGGCGLHNCCPVPVVMCAFTNDPLLVVFSSAHWTALAVREAFQRLQTAKVEHVRAGE